MMVLTHDDDEQARVEALQGTVAGLREECDYRTKEAAQLRMQGAALQMRNASLSESLRQGQEALADTEAAHAR